MRALFYDYRLESMRELFEALLYGIEKHRPILTIDSSYTPSVSLRCMLKDLTIPNCHGLRMPKSRDMPILKATSGPFCSRFDPHKTKMEEQTANRSFR